MVCYHFYDLYWQYTFLSPCIYMRFEKMRRNWNMQSLLPIFRCSHCHHNLYKVRYMVPVVHTYIAFSIVLFCWICVWWFRLHPSHHSPSNSKPRFTFIPFCTHMKFHVPLYIVLRKYKIFPHVTKSYVWWYLTYLIHLTQTFHSIWYTRTIF